MAYYPNIPLYAGVYIQTPDDELMVDIRETFGVVVKSHAIPYNVKPKEPYKNDWKDEHGDDEYIGSTMYMEAFTFTEECVMITKERYSPDARQKLYEQMMAFRNYLTKGEFNFYDTYTCKGFQKVRVSEFPIASSEDYDVFNGKARLIFSVTFKVNDPVTEMMIEDDSIVPVDNAMRMARRAR